MDEVEILLPDDDVVLAKMSDRSIALITRELRRSLRRCESDLAGMVGETSQRVDDLLNRREGLSEALEESSRVEAQVRFRRREIDD